MESVRNVLFEGMIWVAKLTKFIGKTVQIFAQSAL